MCHALLHLRGTMGLRWCLPSHAETARSILEAKTLKLTDAVPIRGFPREKMPLALSKRSRSFINVLNLGRYGAVLFPIGARARSGLARRRISFILDQISFETLAEPRMLRAGESDFPCISIPFPSQHEILHMEIWALYPVGRGHCFIRF